MLDTLLEISQRYISCDGKIQEVLLESDGFREMSKSLSIQSDEHLKRGSTSNVYQTELIDCIKFFN